MAEDFQNYILQLQQVEAALLSDGENPELLKLKQDLEEVIALSKDLKSSLESEESSKVIEVQRSPENAPDAIPKHIAYVPTPYLEPTFKVWKVGDRCLAKWAENGKYYEAIINNIQPDGQVNITFLAYQNRSVVTLDEIKVIKEKFVNINEDRKKINNPKTNQREYLKKRKLKKQQHFKELEQEREVEKNKWLAFSSKSVKKGVKGKSIFASPDSVNGRVGIGTCGMSGKPMTEFVTAEKWKK